MGLFGWLAVAAAVLFLVSALRLAAQLPSREIRPGGLKAVPPTHAPSKASKPAPAAYWEAARAVTKDAVNAWLGTAEVRGKVAGSAAVLEGEWLVNPRYDLPGTIHGGLRRAGAPEDVSSAVAEEVARGWKAWIHGFRATSPSAFPSLAVVPTKESPRVAAAVPSYALRQGESTRDAALTQELAGKLKARLPNEPATEIDRFAGWFAARFHAWKADASLQDLKGGGPVPSYAPPYVPVGPVVGGSLTGRVGSPTPF